MNVSIFEKGWTDIVFEGRNKNYGAYRLRRDDGRTTLTALLLGFLLLTAFTGIAYILQKSDTPQTTSIIPDETVIRVTRIKPTEPATPKGNAAPLEKKEKQDDKKPLINPEPTRTEQAVDFRTDPEPQNQTGTTTATATGTETATGSGTATATGTATGTEGPLLPSSLDRLPTYPGGIDKFYRYVAENFNSRNIDDRMLNVVVSFVVEKDGTMTDIRVVRSGGPAADRESIRVLKSMRKKWEPGISKGQPVRTQYMLPIKILLKDIE